MKHSCDTIIIGGGMVGMTTAIALATAGIRSAVIEPIPAPSQLDSAFDGRVSAIALGSQRMLERLGVWDSMAPFAEPILDIRVVDGHAPFFLHYDHREVGDAPFGWIVENRMTRKALFARAAELASFITIHAPAKAVATTRGTAMASATLDDGTVLHAPLLLAADGKFSKLREQAGTGVHELEYAQTAIVCTIAHSHPHHGLALERFLPIGPFAVLPMQHNRSSLVWTESHDSAKALLALDDAALVDEIQNRIGGYLGELEIVGPRFSYPLSLVHAKTYIAPRMALVGDAAHAIHPIAGQGVNLGFRDVAALAEVLVEARRLGLDLGFETVLARYERWRSFDSLAMVTVTDALNRLFSNTLLPLQLGRRLGLKAVGKLPPLKKLFMRHAMGTMGDLPRLMRGEAL